MFGVTSTIDSKSLLVLEADASLIALVAEREALRTELANAEEWEKELLLGDLDIIIEWTSIALHNARREAGDLR